MAPSDFKAVTRSAFVTARRDITAGIPAGSRGTIDSILGLEQAVMVQFGDTVVRCHAVDLVPGESAYRRHSGSRRRALAAA